MMFEKTLALIKPDAVRAKHVGSIISIIEKHSFAIMCMKKTTLNKEQAEMFYAVHKDKPFFSELIQTITSGPLVAMVLEKKNAIQDWRTLMGHTDPSQALQGTVRRQFGVTINSNAVHGSDAFQTAKEEIGLLFSHM